MLGHEDECDKVMYEGGNCTCGLIRDEVHRQNLEDAATAAGERAELDDPGPLVIAVHDDYDG